MPIRALLAAMMMFCSLHACAAAQPAEADEQPVQLAQYPGAPLEDADGNLWFATVTRGLIRYDGAEFTNYSAENGSLPSNMIRGLLEADDGSLLIATGGGLVRYDGNKFTTFTEYEPVEFKRGFDRHGAHRDLWDVLIDSNGTLWITTMDGVFRHDGEKFVRFPMPVIAADNKHEFTPSMVYRVYEDNEGDLWFGTDGAGAVRYDGAEFTVYTAQSHNLAGDHVCEVFQDSRGVYWFGTSNGGVSRYDGETFTTHLRSKEFSRHTGWGRFMSIIEDDRGQVWFGVSSQGGGVYRYDGEDFQYLGVEQGLGTGGVPSLRTDRAGTVWLGTTAGVYHFDGERFINFTRNNPRAGLPVRSNR